MIASIKGLEIDPVNGILKVGEMSLDANTEEMKEFHKQGMEQTKALVDMIAKYLPKTTIVDSPKRTIEVVIDKDDEECSCPHFEQEKNSKDILAARIQKYHLYAKYIKSIVKRTHNYIQNKNPFKINFESDETLYNCIYDLRWALHLDQWNGWEMPNETNPGLRRKLINEFIEKFEKDIYIYQIEFSNKGVRLFEIIRGLYNDLVEEN